MRKSLFVGSLIALAILTYDINPIFQRPVHVELSFASAQEALPDFTSTTTPSVAPESAWQPTLAIADTEAEAAAASVASPTSAAADQGSIRPKKKAPPKPELPVWLEIPSINLSTSIIQVGLNKKGEMDVPSGNTNHVGWYKGGPKPGQVGSSVLDAHVFAAFENLRYAKVGDEIIVQGESGQKLKFIIQESTVYKLSELTPQMLFNRNDARRLTLITCAGQPVGDTYSHRLVVYAVYAGTV